MKNITLLLPLLFFSLFVTAQHPVLDYVKLLEADVTNNMYDSQYLIANASEVDSYGNLIIVGDFNGSIDMDPSPMSSLILTANPLPSNGEHPGIKRNSFIAKYNASGNLLWAYKIGDNTNYIYARYVTIDASDNIIITGLFKYSVDFDLGVNQEVLTSSNQFRTFIAHYDANGDLNWVNKIEETSFSYDDAISKAIAVKSNGNVIIGGNFNEEISFINPFNTITLNSNTQSAFYAELNGNSGLWNSATQILSGNPPSSLNGIQVDGLDNVICNVVEGGFVFIRALIRKYSSPTVFTDVLDLRNGSNTSLAIESIDVDPSNNLYIAGSFKGTMLQNGISVFLTSTSGNSNEGFLVKLSSSNAVIWKKRLPVINVTYPQSYISIGQIEVDGNDRIIITGSARSGYDLGNGISLPSTYVGEFNPFIAKFDQSGKAKYAYFFENNVAYELQLGGLHLYGSGIYVYGELLDTVDFDFDPDNETYVSTVFDDSDIFFAKYDDVLPQPGGKTLTNGQEKEEALYKIAPTLVIDEIEVVNMVSDEALLKTVIIYDLFNIEVFRMENIETVDVVLKLSRLRAGIYILKGYSNFEEILTSKFVKK